MPADAGCMLVVYLYDASTPGIDRIRREAERYACPLVTIPDRGPLDLAVIAELRRLCKQNRVTIWHGHDHKSDALGLLLRRMHPMRVVTTLHGYIRDTLRSKLYYHADNLALLGMDRVLAVSPALVRHAAGKGVNPSRIRFVPNAIEIERYRYRSPVDQRAYRIGMIGRLSPEKRVDRGLRLVEQLRERGLDVTLDVIGDGPLRSELEQHAQHARFHGWCDDVRQRLGELDLLLLTSETEGLPNAALEAMATGVPVASTAVGGVPFVLDRGGCGLLLPGDESQWPYRVATLLEDVIQRQALSLAARQRVEQHFDFRKRMQRVISIYDELPTAMTAAMRPVGSPSLR